MLYIDLKKNENIIIYKNNAIIKIGIQKTKNCFSASFCIDAPPEIIILRHNAVVKFRQLKLESTSKPLVSFSLENNLQTAPKTKTNIIVKKRVIKPID